MAHQLKQVNILLKPAFSQFLLVPYDFAAEIAKLKKLSTTPLSLYAGLALRPEELRQAPARKANRRALKALGYGDISMTQRRRSSVLSVGSSKGSSRGSKVRTHLCPLGHIMHCGIRLRCCAVSAPCMSLLFFCPTSHYSS